MNTERINLPKLDGHGCFACGTANPIGLNLEFYRRGDSICSDLILNKNYEGWDGMAHGGIISTLLDEVMSWTIIYLKGVFFVTRKMEVKYIKPVLIGASLTVRGELREERRERFIRAQAKIQDGQGQILSKAIGEFVELPPERLSVVPDGMKKEMVDLFRKVREDHRLPSFLDTADRL
jgi:acyl-CoA thioesterase FadM